VHQHVHPTRACGLTCPFWWTEKEARKEGCGQLKVGDSGGLTWQRQRHRTGDRTDGSVAALVARQSSYAGVIMRM
jgi:hypothetical protein